jgi:hypothetical protein
VDTDILDENISYDQMASVTKQEIAFKNDATPGVQASISALNVIQKENEVTINWNSSVQKSNTKETVS